MVPEVLEQQQLLMLNSHQQASEAQIQPLVSANRAMQPEGPTLMNRAIQLEDSQEIVESDRLAMGGNLSWLSIV